MPFHMSPQPNKPILLLDFDGVCHSYTSGWRGADQIPDPPVPGLFEFLTAAFPYFDIQIYSSRSNQAGGAEAMKKWFSSQYSQWFSTLATDLAIEAWPSSFDLPLPNQLKFPTEKPPAFLTIDDRAICFTGDWPLIEDLRNFKPWNKK